MASFHNNVLTESEIVNLHYWDQSEILSSDWSFWSLGFGLANGKAAF